jgi:hypothetical protein
MIYGTDDNNDGKREERGKKKSNGEEAGYLSWRYE